MKHGAWKWIFIGTCLVLGLFLIFKVRAILGPFILAFILAYLMNPLIEVMEKRNISRRKSIALGFVIIIGVLTMIIFLILPTLYNELSKLSGTLPSTIDSFAGIIDRFREQFKSTGLPNKVALVLDEHLGQGEVLIANYLNQFLGKLPNALSSVSLYLLSPVIAIYLLADWKSIREGFFRIVPQSRRMELRRLWQDINHVIREFVRGNLVIAVIVGILIGIGVKLIGMEYALLIGLICGVCDLIPFFGPVIGAVPSVLLALTYSPGMAIKVILVILVVQQIEGGVISPKLMGNCVGLHPIWVIFALLTGGELAGVWGMFISVPVAAVIHVVIKHIYYRLVTAKA